MNISSAIINVLPEHEEQLVETLREKGLCEIHAHESGKIIITIEGENVSDEVAKLRIIERIPNVLSARMVYSYSESELEEERNKIEKAAEFPEWLNDKNIEAKQIPYNGNLKKKY